MRQCASLPSAIITAWEGLVNRAQVSAGQRVLVHGGAGEIGHVAYNWRAHEAQRSTRPGPRPTGTPIRSLGATPIDYTESTVADYVETLTDAGGLDVIFDTVRGRVRGH